MRHIAVAITLCATAAAFAGPAQRPVAMPSPNPVRAGLKARAADMKWWTEARFGLFVHWGPVSLTGREIGWSRGGERPGIGGTGETPWREYDSLYERFNPTRFSAREWVAIAKAAGMRYIVFTTKHHDGFCNFDTKLSDYSIMNAPFGRDVTAELAAECHRAGLRLGFYYSPPDFHHPDYRSKTSASRYIDYMHGQVRELLTNYGKVDIIWFDGLNSSAEELRSSALLPAMRRIQPHLLINNRAGLESDFDTPEQTVGRFQTDRPWESCITICNQWSWKPDDSMKSFDECIGTLVSCASGDGNLLFNVGPMPTGEIEPRQVARLREMGTWLRRYGSTIYGTRGGPFRRRGPVSSTSSGRTIYVHVLDPEMPQVHLPAIDRRVLSARAITGGSVGLKVTDQGIWLDLTQATRPHPDTIIALNLDGPAFTAKPAIIPSLTTGRPARASMVINNTGEYAAARAVDGDDNTRWATDYGVYSAWLEVDLGADRTFDHAAIREACGERVQSYEIQVKQGEGWRTVHAGGRIGPDGEVSFPAATGRIVRLNILRASEGPTIWQFDLFPPEPRTP